MNARCILHAAILFALLPWVADAGDQALRLTPDRVEVGAGESVRFIVDLPDGAAEGDAQFLWEVIPSRLGTIDGSGNFVAGGRSGRGIVRAVTVTTGTPLRGHAVISVSGSGSSRLALRIRPEAVNVRPGEGVQLRAVARDAANGTDLSGRIEWTVTPEWLGSIGADGYFEGGERTGNGRISARLAGESGYGSAHIRASVGGTATDPAAGITIKPSHLEVPTGGSAQLHVDLLGFPEGTAVEWVVLPALLGTVTDGSFQAGPIPMDGRIIALIRTTTGSASATAFARVEGQTAGQGVMVHPKETIVRAGEQIRFELRTCQSSGTGHDLAPVSWSVSDGDAGTIGPDGTFRATDSPTDPLLNALVTGIYKDPATGAIWKAHGRITVITPPDDYTIALRPQVADLPPGEQVRFQVENVPAGIPVTWSVMPRTIGTITPDGLFTANDVFADVSSGEFSRQEGVVIASIGFGAKRYTGQARIIVGGENLATSLVIEPPELRITFPVNEIDTETNFGTFHVRTLGPNPSSTPIVQWKLEGSPLLRVSQTYGRSTSIVLNVSDKRAGDIVIDARVVAELLLDNGQRIGASAPVTVRLTGFGITLQASPPSIELKVGEQEQLSFFVQTLNGRSLDPALVNWTSSFNGKRLGVLNHRNGMFTATTAGQGTLRIRAALKEAPSVQADASVNVIVTGTNSGGTSGSAGKR